MRPLLTALVGISIAAIIYLLLLSAFEKILMPADLAPHVRELYATAGVESKAPPVYLWFDLSSEEKNYWRARKFVPIVVHSGGVAVGKSSIPIEELPRYLDSRVHKGEIEYVLIFSPKGTRWGDVVPIVDACRRSTVRVVLLNMFET